MSTDRELLQELFNFLVKRNYVQGDEAGIMDMVQRYKQPPLTRYHQVCMQMTQADYRNLENLLERIVAHFAPKPEPDSEWHAKIALDWELNNAHKPPTEGPANVSKLD